MQTRPPCQYKAHRQSVLKTAFLAVAPSTWKSLLSSSVSAPPRSGAWTQGGACRGLSVSIALCVGTAGPSRSGWRLEHPLVMTETQQRLPNEAIQELAVTMLDHSDSQPRWSLSDDAELTPAQDPPTAEQTQVPDSRGQCFLFCPTCGFGAIVSAEYCARCGAHRCVSCGN
jgi:hypothetical protein